MQICRDSSVYEIGMELSINDKEIYPHESGDYYLMIFYIRKTSLFE